MNFEEILAASIRALEEGATVEECLARHPLYAEELAPLLPIVAGLRAGPELRLSDRAFAEVRTAIALAARKRQISDGSAAAVTQPAEPSTPAIHTNSGALQAAAWPKVHRDSEQDSQGQADQNQTEQRFGIGVGILLGDKTRHRRNGWFSWPTLASGALAACLLLISLLLVRSAANSLPGHTLYGVKRAAEQTQGALMIAAGERSSWHARQAERRLREAIALQNMGMQVSPTLLAEANAQVLSALAASDSLPPAQRTTFLTLWLDGLIALQADTLFSGAPATALRGTLVTVERALDGEPALVIQSSPGTTATAIAVAIATTSPTATQVAQQVAMATASASMPSATRPAIVFLPSPTPRTPSPAAPQVATLQSSPQVSSQTVVAASPSRSATATPRRPATATPSANSATTVPETRAPSATASRAPTRVPTIGLPDVPSNVSPDVPPEVPTSIALPPRDPTPTWTPPRLVSTATPTAPSEATAKATEMPALAVIPSLAPGDDRPIDGTSADDGTVTDERTDDGVMIDETPTAQDDTPEPASENNGLARAASTTMTTSPVDAQATMTPSVTPTNTMTPTATLTATLTLATQTATAFPTPISTATGTATPTNTTVFALPTESATPSLTPSPTPSPIATVTDTPQESESPTPVENWTPTATMSPEPTTTPWASDTPTLTPTPVPTWTATQPPEPTPTDTETPVPATATATATDLPSPTATPTATLTPTLMPTSSATPSTTPSDLPTPVDATSLLENPPSSLGD